MKKATAKIKEVVRTKDYTNSFGTTIYHDLIMDNGDKIQMGKKKLQQVGWELSYEIVDEQSGEFMKSKSIKPEEVPGSQSNSQSNNGGLNVQHLIVAQSSYQRAIEYWNGSGKTFSLEDTDKTANHIYNWVMSKGK